MKFNKLFLATASILAVSTATVTSAQAEELEISANVAFASDYVFRGVSQTDNDPAVQGGFDLAYGGFYAGTWASNVDQTFYSGANMELDVYLGYGGDIGDTGIGYDVGYLRYMYPSTTFDDNNTDEFHAGVSYDFGPLSAGYTLNYSSDFFGADDALYHSIDVDVPVTEDVSVSLHYGVTDYDDDARGDDYDDWSIGAGTAVMGLDLGLTFTGTSGVAAPTDIHDDKITFTVGKSF